MSRFLGNDIGTSSKSIIVDGEDRLCAEASAELSVQRLHRFWSEQDPETWWQAVTTTLDALSRSHLDDLSAVEATGLSRQMLGVSLVDREGRSIRPALLWNDGEARVKRRRRSIDRRDEVETVAQPEPDLAEGLSGKR